MSTMTEFLLARIAEDRAVAREAQSVESIYGPDFEITYQWARMTRHRISHGSGAGFHPGAPSPARVLAECEAKRQIVEEFEQVHADYRIAPTPTMEGQRFGLAKAVAALASVYADHPDYQEDWKP